MQQFIQNIQNWTYQQLVIRQLNSPLGYLLLLVIVAVVAALVALSGLKGGIALFGVLIGIPVLIKCFFDLEFGTLLTLTCSFFITFLRKFSDIPFGTALDALLLLLLAGLIYRLVKERNFKFATHPISIAIYIWIFYNLLQVINPSAPSIKGWAYAVRSLALWLIIYFVAFHAITSLRFIKRFLILTTALMFLSALYGLKQEYLGFSSQEMAWLQADPLRYQLYFTWSRLRVFSLFADPTSFGIAMAYWGVFCLIMALGKFKMWKRLALIFAAVLMFLSMAYTGSRTPVLMVAIGAVFYVLMNLKLETIIVGVFLVMVGGVFALKSTSNPVIFRIQSAFKPQDDSSMQLRLKNQMFIQPYIQSHPMGAGLATIGVWGRRFNPNSWLADFAPDSAYVRVAVECGWIGLIIYLALFFVALRTVIRYYYRVKDPNIKLIYLGLANVIFLITIANYPQEAAYMLPTNLVFNVILAIIVRLKDFDVAYKE
ncbi:MAG: O-antigen ligase family protein [Bacteroidota bacterium]